MIMSLSDKNLLEKHIKPLQVPQEGKLSEEQCLIYHSCVLCAVK